MKLKIVLEKEPKAKGYHAYCPVLKGCHSCGDTKQEALKNIKEAIELYLQPEEADLKRQIRQHKSYHPQIIQLAI